MKGSLHTDELMRAVTALGTGLRTSRRISHVFVMDAPGHAGNLVPDGCGNQYFSRSRRQARHRSKRHRPLHPGWAGTPRRSNPFRRRDRDVENSGNDRRRCAVQDGRPGADHRRNPHGPLAFDNAVDPEAARIKGIVSAVAGRAQIFVVPDLEAGNMLAKNLVLLAKADFGGHRSWRVGSGHSDVSRGFGPQLACLLCCGGALRRCAQEGGGSDGGVSCHGRDSCHQCRVIERQIRNILDRRRSTARSRDQGRDGRHRNAAAV